MLIVYNQLHIITDVARDMKEDKKTHYVGLPLEEESKEAGPGERMELQLSCVLLVTGIDSLPLLHQLFSTY